VDLSDLDWLKVPSRTKHSNLLRAMRKLKCLTHVDIKFEHMRGHQDDHTHFKDLPLMARLNTNVTRMQNRPFVTAALTRQL